MSGDTKPQNADETGHSLAPTILSIVLLFLPAVMGFFYIWFDVLYTNSLRLVAFHLVWVAFALFVVAFAFITGARLDQVIRRFPLISIILLVALAGILFYTTYMVAESRYLAINEVQAGIVALIAGIAAAAIKVKYGNRAIIGFSWALFGAMILHAPFIVWLHFIEGQNPDFEWNFRLPGFTGARPYNYMLEAGIAAGVGLFWLTRDKAIAQRSLLWLGAIILWAALFWSGGRGGLAALLLTFILATLIWKTFGAQMWAFILSSLTLGASISLVLPTPDGGFGILKRFTADFQSESINQLATGRITMWREAIDLFLERPIFGHGVSQYPLLTKIPDFQPPRHVHNLLLDSLLSLGIVGTVILIYLLGKLWVSALIQLKKPQDSSLFPLFMVVTTLLAHGFVSGTYFHVHSQIIIAMSLGFLTRAGCLGAKNFLH